MSGWPEAQVGVPDPPLVMLDNKSAAIEPVAPAWTDAPTPLMSPAPLTLPSWMPPFAVAVLLMTATFDTD